MPKIVSKRQSRKFFAMAGRGEIAMGKVKKGMKKVGKKGFKSLPERKKKYKRT